MNHFTLICVLSLVSVVGGAGQTRYSLDDFAAMSVEDAAKALKAPAHFGKLTNEDLARAALHSKRMDLIALCISDRGIGPDIYELIATLPESPFRERVQVMMLNGDVLWGPDTDDGAVRVGVPPNETGIRGAQIPQGDVNDLKVGPPISGTGILPGHYHLIMGPDLDERANAFRPLVKKYLPSLVLTKEMLETRAARKKLASDLEAAMPKETVSQPQPSTPTVATPNTQTPSHRPTIEKTERPISVLTEDHSTRGWLPWLLIVIAAAIGAAWLLLRKSKS
jgi:hypothetical protein